MIAKAIGVIEGPVMCGDLLNARSLRYRKTQKPFSGFIIIIFCELLVFLLPQPEVLLRSGNADSYDLRNIQEILKIRFTSLLPSWYSLP